jgi:hypothetical protein
MLQETGIVDICTNLYALYMNTTAFRTIYIGENYGRNSRIGVLLLLMHSLSYSLSISLSYVMQTQET